MFATVSRTRWTQLFLDRGSSQKANRTGWRVEPAAECASIKPVAAYAGTRFALRSWAPCGQWTQTKNFSKLDPTQTAPVQTVAALHLTGGNVEHCRICTASSSRSLSSICASPTVRKAPLGWKTHCKYFGCRRQAFSAGLLRDLAEVWSEEGRETMVKTARTNPAVFFATCARLIPNDVRVTVQQQLPGNLSAENWAMMREIIGAVRQAVPDAANAPAARCLSMCLRRSGLLMRRS